MMKMKTKLFLLFLLFFVFMGISISIGRIDQGGNAQPRTQGEEAAPVILSAPGAKEEPVGPQETTGSPGDTANRGVNTGKNTKSTAGEPQPAIPMSDSFSFIKTLTALTFVLGLIFLAAYLFKKFTGIRTTGLRTRRVPIQMVGYLPLGEKRFLSVVEIQGKHYFLGISQDSINMLSELHLDLSQESSNEKEEQNFETIFNKARQLLKNPYRPMRMKK